MITLADYPTLRSEVESDPANIGYPAGRTPADIAQIGRLLTEPVGMIPNPTPQGIVPQTVTVAGCLGALTEPGLTYIVSLPPSDLEPIAERIRANDHAGVLNWAMVKQMTGNLSQADVDGLTAYVNAAVLDPDWPASVPGPSRLETLFGVGSISHVQITEALQ